MSYKIDEIEGIGKAYAEKLEKEGISTVEELLKRCEHKKERAALSDKTGIPEALILRWTNHADLMRIKGVAGQFAELLEAAGVDTVKEFGHRIAANLHKKLDEVNQERHLCGRIPTIKELEHMIEQAQHLDGAIKY